MAIRVRRTVSKTAIFDSKFENYSHINWIKFKREDFFFLKIFVSPGK